jgi:hypothetical protein
MSEPDFAGLRTVAEDAVRLPEFATIERLADRRRGRLRLAAAAAVAVAVTAVAGTTALAVDRAAPSPPDVGTSSSVPPEPADGSHLVNFFGDGAHLYVTKGWCQPPDCPRELYASDDGGRHWERRTLPSDDTQAVGPAMIGPRTLLMSVPDPDASDTPGPVLTDSPRLLHASTDGGRTWRRVGITTTPIEVVPEGQRLLECITPYLAEPCAVQTLDADLRVAPMVHQPPIDVLFVQAHRPADFGLWVSGVDPSTRKPALAVSRDRGRTWKVSVFTAAAPVDASGGGVGLGNLPELFTADGRTAYVMQASLMGTDEPLIYHTVDGGETWRLIEQGERIQPFSFVTRDGSHVLMVQGSSDIVATRASHNGAPYQPAKLFGLPGSGGVTNPPTPLGGGHGYIVQAASDLDALYVSDDGWTYRRLDLP